MLGNNTLHILTKTPSNNTHSSDVSLKIFKQMIYISVSQLELNRRLVKCFHGSVAHLMPASDVTAKTLLRTATGRPEVEKH